MSGKIKIFPGLNVSEENILETQIEDRFREVGTFGFVLTPS